LCCRSERSSPVELRIGWTQRHAWQSQRKLEKASLSVAQCKKEWISSETFKLVEQKRSLRIKGNVTSYRATDKLRKRQMHKDRQKWADDLAEQAEAELFEGRVKDNGPKILKGFLQ